MCSFFYRFIGTPKKNSSEIHQRLPTAPRSRIFAKNRNFHLCYSYGKWDSRYFWFFYRCILLNYIIYRIQMTEDDHQFIIHPALCISISKCGKKYPRIHHAELAGSRVPSYSSPTILNFAFLTIVLGILV